MDALPELASEKEERIHTTYQQAVASTGRLSSINPNLQNIPIRSEKGREVARLSLLEMRISPCLLLTILRLNCV